MEAYYVCFRCWQDFERDFPYPEYNLLADDEIRPRLLRDARAWYREHRAEAEARRTDRLARLRAEIEKCNRQALWPPRGANYRRPLKNLLPEVLRSPLDVEAAPFWSIAWHAGWVAGWTPPDPDRLGFGVLAPSRRLPLLNLNELDAANGLAAALQRWAAEDTFLSMFNIRLGVMSAEQVGEAEASAEIARLATETDPGHLEVPIWQKIDGRAAEILNMMGFRPLACGEVAETDSAPPATSAGPVPADVPPASIAPPPPTAPTTHPKTRVKRAALEPAILDHLCRRPHDTADEVSTALSCSVGLVAESRWWKLNQQRLCVAKKLGVDPIGIRLNEKVVNADGVKPGTLNRGSRELQGVIEDEISAREKELYLRIGEYQEQHPTESVEEVAKACGCTAGEVEARQARLNRLIAEQTESKKEDFDQEDPTTKRGQRRQWVKKQV